MYITSQDVLSSTQHINSFKSDFNIVLLGEVPALQPPLQRYSPSHTDITKELPPLNLGQQPRPLLLILHNNYQHPYHPSLLFLHFTSPSTSPSLTSSSPFATLANYIQQEVVVS